MDIVRIITGTVLVIFFLWGIRRGLIRQVCEVVGLVAAFVGSFYLSHQFSTYLQGKFDFSGRIAFIIAAIAIFVGVVIAFHFIGVSLQKLFKLTMLGSFDRVLGGIVGVFKGIILMSLVFVIFMSMPFQEELQKEIEDDPFTGAIYPVLPVLFDIIVSRTGVDFAGILKNDLDVKGDELIKKAVRNR